MSIRKDESTRIKRIERLRVILQRHEGLSEAELADMLRLERRTLNNYLRELENEGKIYKEGRLWFAYNYRETRLRTFDLTPEEAMTLYLGARLLVKQHDRRNEPAETALLKLAEVLNADAGIGDEILQAAQELARRPVSENYQPIFRTLMRGYVYRRQVEIKYQPLQGQPFSTYFSTYLIEPSPVGYATYLIGHSRAPNAMRAYKLERVLEARLTDEDYLIPAEFNGLEMLRHAWSIVMGELRVKVVVRFSSRVRRRVLETIWHTSQETQDDPERPGALLWNVTVADTLDLLPWLRSWGSDAQVLEPPQLRERLAREARQLARLYEGETTLAPPAWFYLWAKAEPSSERWHPLLYHMIDVGQVALALWQDALSPHTRRWFAGWLNLDEEQAGRLVAFWASLHDLGKAGPSFQQKRRDLCYRVQTAGLQFPTSLAGESAHHGSVSTWALQTLLVADLDMEKRPARQVARAVGGHHGSWPTSAALSPTALRSADKGDEGWTAARRELFLILKTIFSPPPGVRLPVDDQAQNAMLTLLSGLVSVADWIGSMELFFTYEETYLQPTEYAIQSVEQAMQALRSLGWIGWQPSGDQLAFAEMFPGILAPNTVQQAVFEVTESLAPPALLILEAPTGTGKTEAALYLADCWLQQMRGKGLYVAMPTQATSNQMFGRVVDYLKVRYSSQKINLHLAHGQAQYSQRMNELQPMGVSDRDSNENEGNLAAMTWFLPRKRTLLAPFGVGTVDQALMCVLQTRHFFVRLFGLAHKVVIFDEVHAYDAYMSVLFRRLLGWLRAVGTSVIILSATLPDHTRRALATAYQGRAQPADLQVTPSSAAYPRLTVVSEAGLAVHNLPSSAERQIILERIHQEPEAIAAYLQTQLAQGGLAAVIVNRVERARQVYQALQATNIVEPKHLLLFHARFPFAWREAIEEKALNWAGKDGERPSKAILIATQVIEQSLDLDFDLMVSDPAPVDLLLQRIGRLHRHTQNNESRPPRLAQPRLALTEPNLQEGVPEFGKDEYIYARSVLLRSWLVLQSKERLYLPTETEALIEAVYGQEPISSPDLAGALQAADERLRREIEREQHEALKRLIPKSDDEDLLINANQGLEEDDALVHQALRALTRLIEPSVSLVCLHQTSSGLALEPDGRGAALDLEQRPSGELTEALLRRVISVQDRRLVAHFQTPNLAWKKIAALRRCFPVIFDNGRCTLPESNLVLSLDLETGLAVEQTTD